MENSNSAGEQMRKSKLNPAEKLKNRLFQKGIGHSSMSSFKSPQYNTSPMSLSNAGPMSDYGEANNILLVNLNSSNSNKCKMSPKVIRKQVAGFPNFYTNSVSGNSKTKTTNNETNRRYIDQNKDKFKTTTYDKFITKQSYFLQDIASEAKKQKAKYQTSVNFYSRGRNQNERKVQFDSIQQKDHQSKQKLNSKSLQNQKHISQEQKQKFCSDEFKRAKKLVQKLTGKSKFQIRQQKKPGLINLNYSKNDANVNSGNHSLSSSRQQENNRQNLQSNSRSLSKYKQAQKMTFQDYISRALRNQQNLQQFLYLSNTNPKPQKQHSNPPQQDPYQLHIIQYQCTPITNTTSSLTSGQASTQKPLQKQKYYTISKKGLCYYVNGKPVQFIELEEWVSQRENYRKIKGLNFFNRFRKWKTVKMWRKIVLRCGIEQCKKNLQEKLFFLNSVMRSCLFQVQKINLDIGKNFVIIGNNQDDYSLENFKIIQQKNKKSLQLTIDQNSKNSRISVRKCFQQCLKHLKGEIKQKQQTEQAQQQKSYQPSNPLSSINQKDSAFQALGFPPKMSYQNRSKLRKLAGRFIRFSYLVDMIYSIGLALTFRGQLLFLIKKLEESQGKQNLQIIMSREDAKGSRESCENVKFFNIKLHLNEKDIQQQMITNVAFQTNQNDGIEKFNPLYHIKKSSQAKQSKKISELHLRQYIPKLASIWLELYPKIPSIQLQLESQIRQSLNCLRFFQRWSKHRQMEKFINILEQWDDVVSESREIVENQNLDPVAILSGGNAVGNVDVLLAQVKNILGRSFAIIGETLQRQFTETLNLHWEQSRIDLQLFKDPKLQNPTQTVHQFLQYITGRITQLQRHLPHRIRLGIFQIQLSQVRNQLLQQSQSLYQQFKLLLPQVVEQNTLALKAYFSRYNEVIDLQINNIDDFVSKVKYIKEIQKSFQLKKQLCINLTGIYQIMEVYKLNTKKRKEYQTVTLKLKDQLQKQVNSFQQNFQRQAENYSRQVYKNYLPNVVRDIGKLSTLVKNQKYVNFGLDNNGAFTQKHYNQVTRQIQDLQKKYEDVQQRNLKCIQYQQILNQCHGVDQQSLQNTKNALTKPKNRRSSQINSLAPSQLQSQLGNSDSQEVPTYLQDLFTTKNQIHCLLMMWQKLEKWNRLLSQYGSKTLKQILLDRESLEPMIKEQRVFINNKLKKVIGTNQVVNQLDRIVDIFQRYLLIITGLSDSLTQSHWHQLSQIIPKPAPPLQPLCLSPQRLSVLTLSNLLSQNIGSYRDQFQQIFTKARNELKLKQQYNQLQKKWRNTVVKTKVEGKFHVISEDSDRDAVMALINQSLSVLGSIMSNGYSAHVIIGPVCYQSVLFVMELFMKWISIQKKLVSCQKISKSIDMKKINEGNLIQNAQKQYKALFKVLQSRNIDSYFNLSKFLPNTSSTQWISQSTLMGIGHIISQKLQQCQKILNSFQTNIKNMLYNQYRKNYPLFYQLSDIELLHLVMETSNQSLLQNIIGVVDQLICGKFLPGIVIGLKFQGERIKGIYTIDDDINSGKPSISLSLSLTSPIETILDQIFQSISQYTRRMLKSCRTKSLETSLLNLCNQFNIQFLVAISKVDFSNYTAISIQNCVQNGQALRQYLKIMRKDTRGGIKGLKEKVTTPSSVLAYETLILQNLYHEKILQQLVHCNVTCANQYTWLKHLRYYWQEKQQSQNSTSQQTCICVKKMHIGVYYGKQYIGSKTRVYMQNNSYSDNGSYNNEYDNLDLIMSAIRNSKVYTYLGAGQRLAFFVTTIGHRFERISCKKEMMRFQINPLKTIIKARYGTDCCFFVQNSHLLSTQAMSQLMNIFTENMNRPKLSSVSQPTPSTEPCPYPNIPFINLPSSSADQLPQQYNPIFLSFPQNQNSIFNLNKYQYRNVSLATPGNGLLVCYLQLIEEQIYAYITIKEDSSDISSISHRGKNNISAGSSRTNHTHGHSHRHHHKTQSCPQQNLTSLSQPQQNQVFSHNETIIVLKKVFDTLNELEKLQNNCRIRVQAFLEHVRDRVSRILRNDHGYKISISWEQKIDRHIEQYIRVLKTIHSQLSQPHAKIQNSGSLPTAPTLHCLLLTILLQYIKPTIKSQNYAFIYEYLRLCYPKITEIVKLQHQSNKKRGLNEPQSKIQVKILVGYQDCLRNYNKLCQKQVFQEINQVNLLEFSDEQLYGTDSNPGLLHRILYEKYSQLNQKDDKTLKKRKLIINGISLRLVQYLQALVQQNTVAKFTDDNQAVGKNFSPQNSLKVFDIIDKKSNFKKTDSIMQQVQIQSQSQQQNSLDYQNLALTILQSLYSNPLQAGPSKSNNSLPKRHCCQYQQLSTLSLPPNTDTIIQVNVTSLSNIIDPKLMTSFHIQTVLNTGGFQSLWKYAEERVKVWCHQGYNNIQRVGKNIRIFENCVMKFYNSVIKGLWKDIYKVAQPSLSSQSLQTTLPSNLINSLRDFLNMLQTLTPYLLSQTLESEELTSAQYHKQVIHACIYSLCFVYKSVIDLNTEYVKLENILDKLQAEAWLCIPDKERIFPGQYSPTDVSQSQRKLKRRRPTYFDFIFDGSKLVYIDQYCRGKQKQRIIQRGQFYLSNQLIHLSLITQRVLNTRNLGLLLYGPENSGKSTFCQIYKSLHHQGSSAKQNELEQGQTAYLTIHAMNKSKQYVYNKICNVLGLRNLSTVGARLGYKRALVFVDDLALEPSRQNDEILVGKTDKIACFIASLINNNYLRTYKQYKRYSLENLNFIICSNSLDGSSNLPNPICHLQNCTIKYNLSPSVEENSLKFIFTQIMKANILDPQINEKCISYLITVAFDYFQEICIKLPKQSNGVINLGIIKKMALLTSHLRFKQNYSSVNQIHRFWGYLLKDTLQQYCSHYSLSLAQLSTYKQPPQPPTSSKQFSQFMAMPLPNLLYSHLFVKQQIYGNGKQVQHIRDIRKLYNSINQTIQEYNKTDQVKRYGYSFQFISIDQLIIKIVKISNMLLTGDYAVFARKGSEIPGIIRLVSYMQGFNFKEILGNSIQAEPQTISNVVRDTILELTKVSLYLISVKITDQNIKQFIDFYESDFEIQIIGALQGGSLSNVQATGAVDFGITQASCSKYNLQYTKNQRAINVQGKPASPSHKSSQQTPQIPNSASQNKDILDSCKISKIRSQNPNQISSKSIQSTRTHRYTLRQVNKIKRSIRLVYQFNSIKYLKYKSNHPYYIAPYILSQLHIDFFNQYPKQSLLRFSQQILGIHSSDPIETMSSPSTNLQNTINTTQKTLTQCPKDKVQILYQIYCLTRVDLSLSLKDYEEAIKLYWSFLGTFPEQMKERIEKLGATIDLYTKIDEIINEINTKVQNMLDQKKSLTQIITKLKPQKQSRQAQQTQSAQLESNSECGSIRALQSTLASLTASLQQQTQSRSQCQKIKQFLSPTISQLKAKYNKAVKLLQNNGHYLKIDLAVVASYFVYLSRVGFGQRKNWLARWYSSQSIKNIVDNQNLTSVNQLFSLIRDEDEIITHQNQQFYENITIIFESIKPVLIRDNQHIGRSWMRNFDQSFVTITQPQLASQNSQLPFSGQSNNSFYSKLGQYLSTDNNILLQITNQSTLNNSQHNYINSLVFMSENTPKVEINDHEYEVSKLSKVYIIVAPHIEIPEEIGSDYLYISYQRDEAWYVRDLEREFKVKSEPKYMSTLQYAKRIRMLSNQCVNYETSLVQIVFTEFYSRREQQEQKDDRQKSSKNSNTQQNQQQTLPLNISINNLSQTIGLTQGIKSNSVPPPNTANSTESVYRLKSKQQIVQNIKVITKSMIVDKLQQLYDKYNISIKQLRNINKKMSDIQCQFTPGTNSHPYTKYLQEQEQMANKRHKRQTPIGKVLNIIQNVYLYLQRLNECTNIVPISLDHYYETVKKAIRAGIISIDVKIKAEEFSLNQVEIDSFNIGSFVLFVLRQWGQRLNRQWYLILAVGLIVIVEQELYQPSRQVPYNDKCLQPQIQSILTTIIKSIQPLLENCPNIKTNIANKKIHPISLKKNTLLHKICQSTTFSIELLEQLVVEAITMHINIQNAALIGDNGGGKMAIDQYVQFVICYNCVPNIMSIDSLHTQSRNKLSTYHISLDHCPQQSPSSSWALSQNPPVNPSLAKLAPPVAAPPSFPPSAGSYDNTWLLKHLVLITGSLHGDRYWQYQEQFGYYGVGSVGSNRDNGRDGLNQWMCRQALERLLQNEQNGGGTYMANNGNNSGNIVNNAQTFTQIKNIESIDNQIKKIVNEKYNLFIPIIYPYGHEQILNSQLNYHGFSKQVNSNKCKYQTILQLVLVNLLHKYSPQRVVQQIRHEQQSNRINKDSFLGLTSSMTNSAMLNSSGLRLQSASLNSMRLSDDFRIYVYHPDLKELIAKLEKVMKVRKQQIVQKAFVRDMSNCLNVNLRVSKLFAANFVNKPDQLQDSYSIGISINNSANIGQHYFKCPQTPSKTKKNIQIVQEQKSQKIRFQPNLLQSHPISQKIQGQKGQTLIPSMRVLQPLQPSKQQLAEPKTHKMVPTSSNQTVSSPPTLSSHLHSATSLLLNHIISVTAVGTNSLITYQHLQRQIVPFSYFYGIDKILQPIAYDNQRWTYGKSLVVICRIIKKLLTSIRGFFARERHVKLIDRIIKEIRQYQISNQKQREKDKNTVNNALINSIQKLKPQSHKNLQQQPLNPIPFDLVQKYTQMVKKILSEDLMRYGFNPPFAPQLNSIKQKNNNQLANITLQNRIRYQTELSLFKSTWLLIFTRFLGVNNQNRSKVNLSHLCLSFDSFYNKLNINPHQIIVSKTKKQANSQEKRTSSRKSRNLLSYDTNNSQMNSSQTGVPKQQSKGKSQYIGLNKKSSATDHIKQALSQQIIQTNPVLGTSVRFQPLINNVLANITNILTNSENSHLNSFARYIFERSITYCETRIAILKEEFNQMKKFIGYSSLDMETIDGDVINADFFYQQDRCHAQAIKNLNKSNIIWDTLSALEQLSQSQVPQAWQSYLGSLHPKLSRRPLSLSSWAQNQQQPISVSSSNPLTNINQNISETLQFLEQCVYRNKQELIKSSKDPNHAFDLSYLPEGSGLDIIRAYFGRVFQVKNPIPSYHINLVTKQQLSNPQINNEYYCVTTQLSPQQLGKTSPYLKLKSIYAQGWKLTMEGNYQPTQQDKITQLNNVYIVRRPKPQQFSVCEVILMDCQTADTTQAIQLYAFTKKNLGLKVIGKLAFIQDPEG